MHIGRIVAQLKRRRRSAGGRGSDVLAGGKARGARAGGSPVPIMSAAPPPDRRLPRGADSYRTSQARRERIRRAAEMIGQLFDLLGGWKELRATGGFSYQVSRNGKRRVIPIEGYRNRTVADHGWV